MVLVISGTILVIVVNEVTIGDIVVVLTMNSGMAIAVCHSDIRFHDNQFTVDANGVTIIRQHMGVAYQEIPVTLDSR